MQKQRTKLNATQHEAQVQAPKTLAEWRQVEPKINQRIAHFSDRENLYFCSSYASVATRESDPNYNPSWDVPAHHFGKDSPFYRALRDDMTLRDAYRKELLNAMKSASEEDDY